MQDQNKAITALVRSMKRTLQVQHGINVPHTALRASYLQALGENAHAFAGREQATAFAVEEAVTTPVPVDTSTWRTLYLAEDDIGCLERFSLDEEGRFRLPDDFVFKNATLMQQVAEIPNVSRYGQPDYLAKPGEFYAPYQLKMAEDLASVHTDLGDDSGDSCKITVAMPEADWQAILSLALEKCAGLASEVGFWVGVHYKQVFNQEPKLKQLDWVQRYLDLMAEGSDVARDSWDEDDSVRIDIKFDWRGPNGQSGSIGALLEVDTGLIVMSECVLLGPDVVTTIRVPHNGDSFAKGAYGETFPAHYELAIAGRGCFKVTRDVSARVAKEYGLKTLRA